MGMLMAEKKKPSAEKPNEVKMEKDGLGPKPSVRLTIGDAQKLQEVSTLRQEKSAALTFRRLFGALLDAELIKLAEGRAKGVRQERGE